MNFWKSNHDMLLHSLLLIILSSHSTLSQQQQQQQQQQNGQNVPTVTIPACSDYTDLRSTTAGGSPPFKIISIPPERTSRRQGPLSFQLESDLNLKCPLASTELRAFPWSFNESLIEDITPRDFYKSETVSSGPHKHSYFTSAGYFYDNTSSIYYKPKGDYCVASYSDEAIVLKVCAASENNDCANSAIPNAWCLPKCCPVDEVMLFWKRVCVPRAEIDGVTPWIPPVYKSQANPHQQLENIADHLLFRMSTMPKNCNVRMLKGGNMSEPLFKWLSASAVVHPKDPRTVQRKDPVKLVAPTDGKSGTMKPIFLHSANRRWDSIKGLVSFCVEGFYVKTDTTPTYTGIGENFVVFHCDDNEDTQDPSADVKAWVYFGVSVLAILFLLVTILVYAVLWDKQNLHGLTVVSYSVSTFASYLFLAMAHMISLYPDADATGIFERGPFCYTIATLAHYFYISSYLWLTVMNFDLWLTFRSIRVVRRESKEWKRFGLYSLVGAFFPMVLIIAFVIIDETYRDPITEVPVPDYATSTCFVSPDFRGEYVYIPMAIMLLANILLIGLTMQIFINARSTKLSEGPTNANRYSAKLFAKLFIVMGGTSLVDFFTWYYNNKMDKPWAIVALECVTYLLTPLALFILFCLNERVISQMRGKYPVFTDSIQPVLRIFSKSESGVSSAETSTTSNKTADSAIGWPKGSSGMSLKRFNYKNTR